MPNFSSLMNWSYPYLPFYSIPFCQKWIGIFFHRSFSSLLCRRCYGRRCRSNWLLNCLIVLKNASMKSSKRGLRPLSNSRQVEPDISLGSLKWTCFALCHYWTFHFSIFKVFYSDFTFTYVRHLVESSKELIDIMS